MEHSEPTLEHILEPTPEHILEPILEHILEPTLQHILEPTRENILEPTLEHTHTSMSLSSSSLQNHIFKWQSQTLYTVLQQTPKYQGPITLDARKKKIKTKIKTPVKIN